MDMIPSWVALVFVGVQLLLGAFWLVIIIAVPMTPVRLFEDHKHKHLWLYTVCFVPIIGAIWFCVWRFSKHSEYADALKKSGSSDETVGNLQVTCDPGCQT